MADIHQARNAADAPDISLKALRQRMERMDEKIIGDTAFLNALADRVAEQKRLSEANDQITERKA